MKRPTKIIIPLMFLHVVLLSGHVYAQEDGEDSLRSGGSKEFRSVSLNRPSDLHEEWWLFLKNGRAVQCNGSDIRIEDENLEITGTLKNMSIPRADVTSILMKPAGNRLRNGFLLGLYFGSAFFMSASDAPAAYAGDSEHIPGFNLTGLFLAAATGGAVALVNSIGVPPASSLALDGTESEEAWRNIMESRRRDFHIRGLAAFTRESGGEAWKRFYEDQGAVKPSYRTSEKDVTSFNFLRSLSVTYSLSDRLEAGIALQTGGVPEFTREYTYYVSGNPPIAQTINLGGSYRTNGFHLAINYLFLPFRPRAFSLRAGIGAGIGELAFSETEDPTYYFWTSAIKRTPTLDAKSTSFTMNVNAGLEYFFDASLSVGLQADYTYFTPHDLPEQVFREQSGFERLRLPAKRINLDSFAVGISFGWHY